MMWLGLVLFGQIGIFFAQANDCSDACDKTYQSAATTAVSFCGTDRLTHNTYFEAVDNDYCYAKCGLMAQYSGACGCANGCQEVVGQGKCDTANNLCVCSPGWGGNDCSLPKVGNPCSYHGKLLAGGVSGSKFPFDYCQCDAGFTGIDCSSPIFTGSALPWGELYPEVPQYSSADAYGDAHPVFNLSHFATIRVVLEENDYISLLLPDNLYNESYASATIFFDNNNVQATFANVGFRIKGAYSRLDQKKGWAVKFNEFVKGQNFFGLKKLGMKAGSVNDDTLLKTKLYNDFYRTMNAVTQRSSFALLYINDRFAGVYYMHEDIGSDFAASRLMVDNAHYEGQASKLQDTGNGNLYKLFYNVNLGYFGDDAAYYQTKAHVNELGVSMYYYEQSDGNGDWSDWINLLYYFNTSDYSSPPPTHTSPKSGKVSADKSGSRNSGYPVGSNFYETVESVMEVDNLLRGSVVECFMLGTDNMASGANYYLYHHNYDKDASNANNQRWSLFDADFDECFSFDPATKQSADAPNDILAFFTTNPLVDAYSSVNPLMNGLLAPSSPYRAQYLQHYQRFLQHVFQLSNNNNNRAVESNPLPQERYNAMKQFLLPWIVRDQLWQFSFNMTGDKFVQDAEFSMQMLPLRAQDTWQQTSLYLQKQ